MLFKKSFYRFFMCLSIHAFASSNNICMNIVIPLWYFWITNFFLLKLINSVYDFKILVRISRAQIRIQKPCGYGSGSWFEVYILLIDFLLTKSNRNRMYTIFLFVKSIWLFLAWILFVAKHRHKWPNETALFLPTNTTRSQKTFSSKKHFNSQT